MELSGEWTIKLDPGDQGLAQAWHNQALPSPDGSLNLPGSLQSQGFGDAPGIDTQWIGDIRDPQWFKDPRFARYTTSDNFKFPFWLQPEKVYTGPAWYQREIEIPAAWQGLRVTLSLERAHWGTRAWLDGSELTPSQPGLNLSLSVPHVYELGALSRPGKHLLTLRVDNRMLINVGPNAHSMSDHTQTNWNGVVGCIELRADAPVWVDDVQVYPSVADKTARLAVRLGSALGKPGAARVTVQACLYNEQIEMPNINCSPAPLVRETPLEAGGAQIELVYALGDDAQTWDEFNPTLYRMLVLVDADVDGRSYTDECALTFGLREIAPSGTQLAINGRALFLRGTLECAIFPLTGYPPTGADAWKRILTIARGYGLNHLRFHSNCPPEAAFQVADEMGFYFQVECPSWANQGASLGEGTPLDEWLYEEGRRIIAAYGNHPSFIMMAYGNEPGGRFVEYLTDWVNYWKARDPRRVYTSGAGWPAIEPNQYHNIPQPRIQGWGEGLGSRINALPPETLTDYSEAVQAAGRPIISHEIGQWCVYPNFDEIEKYTGHIKARNFEIFRDSLAEHGMADQARDFLFASGRLQVLCYKEEIESALRTPGFGGFQLLDLHDFPGQGTALVGVLDPFWDDKGYVTGPEYSRFCNALVPLARMEKRAWLEGETFRAALDLANFGPAALQGVAPAWRLTAEDGSLLGHGTLPAQDIPLGNTAPGGGPLRLGEIALPLPAAGRMRKAVLSASLPGVANPNGGPVENDWEVWIYPRPSGAAAAPTAVRITRALDAGALAELERGGSVLLLLPPDQVKVDSVIGFSSMFWNVAWTGYQPPHTLGILADPAHPVFSGFATERHTNWQWWDLIHGAAAMTLDGLPRGLRPLVQPIDAWFDNRRLGLLFEARACGGRLIVASMDLESDLEHRHAARVLRQSILSYMASADFRPEVEVSCEALAELAR